MKLRNLQRRKRMERSMMGKGRRKRLRKTLK